MKTLSLLIGYLLASQTIAMAGDTPYPGTLFCDQETGYEEHLEKVVYKQITTDRANLFNFFTANDKAVESFCKGTTAIKKIKATVIAYDLKFAEGLAIDQVSDYRNATKASFRKLAQSYFAVTSRVPKKYSCTNSLRTGYELYASGMDDFEKAGNYSGFFAVSLNNPDQLKPKEFVKGIKLSQKDLDQPGANAAFPQILITGSSSDYQAVLTPGSYYQKFYPGHRSSVIHAAPMSAQFKQSSAFYARDKMEFSYANQSKTGPYVETELMPLSSACVGEACALRRDFLFGDLPAVFRKDTLKLADGIAKDEETKKWTITATARDSDEIWDAYMSHFTTVKEIQVPEDKLTQYEVELDLEPFCRYALPRKDMIAK
jgi:hypothetical protein